MAFTGGLLNELNGKMGISAAHNSVPVMKLIRAHNPKSKEELVELISSHSKSKCKCGVISKGSVYDFGKKLFKAQQGYWKEEKFTLQECIQWEYDLFVIQSLKGGSIEKKAIKELSALYDYQFAESDGYVDEELRIDIIIKDAGAELAGVQVKPASFKHMRSEIITFNIDANKKWGKPVFYLYYDNKEEFVNLREIFSQ